MYLFLDDLPLKWNTTIHVGVLTFIKLPVFFFLIVKSRNAEIVVNYK